MARIKHYYIISYNAVYHALIGSIKDSCSFLRLAFGFKKRARRRPLALPVCSNFNRAAVTVAPNFHLSQFHKYGPVERIRCCCPRIWATPTPPHPTPSPSFCTGCCVVLPAQVSPNPFPRPCCAINPHPQTIGQS